MKYVGMHRFRKGVIDVPRVNIGTRKLDDSARKMIACALIETVLKGVIDTPEKAIAYEMEEIKHRDPNRPATMFDVMRWHSLGNLHRDEIDKKASASLWISAISIAISTSALVMRLL